jgi:hypothetical protein
VSIIFQLFCAEDLQRLTYQELEELRQTIISALGDAPTLPLKLTPNTTPDPVPPAPIQEALNKRFQDISHQLKAPQLNPPQQDFNFATLMTRLRDSTTQTKEDRILEWALSCEVNHFEFYNVLLRARTAAYDFFDRTIKAQMAARKEPVPDAKIRPKDPDSPYSPFNPRHPLSKLFYNL